MCGMDIMNIIKMQEQILMIMIGKILKQKLLIKMMRIIKMDIGLMKMRMKIT